MMRSVEALWKREVRKFVRDRGRVVGAIGQPIGFWLFLGLGFGDSFRGPTGTGEASSYLVYLFPGILMLTVLFTALFSTISIVEERRSGFLQAAVISPAKRSALLAGTISGGVTLALAEALLFLLAVPFLPLSPGWSGLVLAAAGCAIAAIGFTAMGVFFAWRAASTRGFHGVMNMVMLPLWLLSGAVFPLDGAHPAIATVMHLNPVTYMVRMVRDALATGSAEPIPVVVAVGFAAALAALAHRAVSRPPADED